MKILENVLQGTDTWLGIRAKHFTASEAPSASGVSKYLSRSELLQQKSTGICKEISDFQQSVFDKGHKAEATARTIAEDIVGEDLYPITATLSVDELPLLASYDGINLGQNIIWEHKLWSAELAKQIEENNINEHYSTQLDQQLLISGADKCLFMASDGTINNCKWMWYKTTEEKKTAIISTWKRFARDLETFEPKEFAEKPQAEAIMQLPALSIQIKGEVTVSNLPQFKEAAEAFISNINTDLENDEDFVNAESTVKFCDETEKKLESVKAEAIGQTASIDELMRTIDFIRESIRSKRLTLEKLVKSQKENIKTKIIDDAYIVCLEHISQIDKELYKTVVFFRDLAISTYSRKMLVESCKNKRTLESLNNAVDTEVAAIKIKLDDLAHVIRKNLAHLPDDLSLFRDLQSIITKPEDDFKLLVASRLAEQKRKEEETARRAIAEAKAKEEAEATRIAAASERMRQQKESKTKRIESLPSNVKSARADEERIAEGLGNTAHIIGFEIWWLDVGSGIQPHNDKDYKEFGARISRAAWDYAKSHGDN